MATYALEDLPTVTTIYDKLDDWCEVENISSLLNYIPKNSVNFQVSADLAKSVRSNGYLHILAKSVTLAEFVPLANSMKDRLVYVFQKENKFIFCFFNSYDTEPDIQTERVVYEISNVPNKPQLAFLETGNQSYLYYLVASAQATSSLNCYMKATAMLCPEFTRNFQTLVATSNIYGVGTYGFANGGKRLILSKNDNTYELMQLNLDRLDKIYALNDLKKFE